MFISHRFNCVFIHIQKTGGASVTEAFRALDPDLEIEYYRHIRFKDLEPHLVNRGINYYRKFAFVRNPLDRLVSWYRYINDVMRHDVSNPMVAHFISEGGSFEEFVAHCSRTVWMQGRNGTLVPASFAFDQLDYCLGSSGEMGLDFVCRFETLTSSMVNVAEDLGIPLLQIPHLNRATPQSPILKVSSACRKIISERFARDLEKWEYCV